MPDNAVTDVDSSPTPPELPEGEATQPAERPTVEQLQAQLTKEREEKDLVVRNNGALLEEKRKAKEKEKEAQNKAKDAAQGQQQYQVLSEIQAKQIQDFEGQATEMATLRAMNDSNLKLATQTVELKMSTMPDHIKQAVEDLEGWADANPFDKIQKIEWAQKHIPDPTKNAKVPGGGQPPGTTNASDQEFQKSLDSREYRKALEQGFNRVAAGN